jgi:hypothetical protein
LKAGVTPDAPPAKRDSAELTFAAKRRAAEIIAGLEREGVAVTLKDDRLRVTAKGRPRGAALLEVEPSADLIEAYLRTRPRAASNAGVSQKGRLRWAAEADGASLCSPKPSNRDGHPLFTELRALTAQQHVARS